MQNTKQTKKMPICKKCYTPMKGHKRGFCRPNPWYDGKTQQERGGHYEWESQRWNGSEWKPIVVAAVNKNQVIVNNGDAIAQFERIVESELEKFISTGTVIHLNHHLADDTSPAEQPKEPEEPKEPEKPKEAEEAKDEWKPLASESWWNYYRNWQQNSTWVKFPTLMGMTGAQLGDIMENYGKYRNPYN